MSGTPVQNRLTDLGTLFYFLRIYPFNDPSFFDREILHPWRKRSDVAALDKLRMLVHFITIRRSKEVLQLMPREDCVEHLHFTSSEREMYDKVKSRTRDAFSEFSAPRAWAMLGRLNVLVWIDSLRKICNHGVDITCSSLPVVQNGLSHCHSVSKLNRNGDKFELSEAIGTEDSSGLDFLDYISERMVETSSEPAAILSPASTGLDILDVPTSHDYRRPPCESYSPDTQSSNSPEWPSSDRISTPSTAMAAPAKIRRLVRDLMDVDTEAKR